MAHGGGIVRIAHLSAQEIFIAGTKLVQSICHPSHSTPRRGHNSQDEAEQRIEDLESRIRIIAGAAALDAKDETTWDNYMQR